MFDPSTAYHECLLRLDVARIIQLQAMVNPHADPMDPREALCSLHMARVDAKSMPPAFRKYSMGWLAERGFSKVDGMWKHGPVVPVAVEAVGYASGAGPGIVTAFNRKVTQYVTSALENAFAKGITEAPMHREIIMKTRDKVRRKAGRV